MKKALTIAGSDSGGGAGIQADLKTFAALGVHGMSVITSVTAQNTYEVRAVHDIPLDIIKTQFEAVVEDIGVDAAKTGMLSRYEVVELVSSLIKSYSIPVVVDPVMVAKSGAPLLKENAVEALIKYLIPIATVVTPNRFEAEKLTSIAIKSIDDAKRAARKIVEDLGARAAIVKGGHMEGEDSIDILYVDGVYREFRAKRIETRNTHGTGCSFSAAIAAELAKGKNIVEAVKTAKEFITIAIEHGLPIGKGHGPVNPMAWLYIPAERYKVLEDLKKAIDILEANSNIVVPLIPEVGMNIAVSLPKPYARSLNDVAAIPGRIVRAGNKIKVVSSPEFGASKHMARAILKAIEYNENVRAVANIKFSEKIIEIARELGFTVAFYDRSKEPPEIKSIEGGSIPWGIEQAIKMLNNKVPDIVYHRGDWGKEPMINIFGRTATEVVEKMLILAEKLFGLEKQS
ncbi:MAG: bifunctional hydroxymethylpyrimidine kinase/phosphomethylpyrimidine kinase [Ignisphaera sp.]|uniref:Bifunctional thiamine biosynthesis protein ThiDN n=1 Tax=Ignisphaera aggregans TaxID=334771 RepID=A0A7J3MX16_9CREN